MYPNIKYTKCDMEDLYLFGVARYNIDSMEKDLSLGERELWESR